MKRACPMFPVVFLCRPGVMIRLEWIGRFAPIGMAGLFGAREFVSRRHGNSWIQQSIYLLPPITISPFLAANKIRSDPQKSRGGWGKETVALVKSFSMDSKMASLDLLPMTICGVRAAARFIPERWSTRALISQLGSLYLSTT